MFNVLEGDGVIDNIYHFLWTKDTIFNTDPYIFIPQTILYRYQKPCYWYFTSKKDFKLKKKSTGRLNNDHIREVFLKKISKSGIVAYYIYKKKGILSKYESDKPTFEKTMKTLVEKSIQEQNEQIRNRRYNSKSESENINDSSYIIEYFNIKKFEDFLNNKIVYDDGILQKFVDPKGDYNITYRLNWSPKLCLFEKCTNLKKIEDLHYDMYERAVTYDGEEFQTKTEPLKGSNLPERIEKIGLSIATHVSNITLEKIKIIRLILNFKIDRKDRIIFLWCSSLRIENNTNPEKVMPRVIYNKKSNRFNAHMNKVKEVDVEKIKLRPPEDINIFKYSISGKPIQPHKETICLNCGQKVENYKLYEISFKTLIEGHDNRKKDKQFYSLYDKINMTASGIEVLPISGKPTTQLITNLKENNYNNFIIPKVIAEIYPKLKFEDYFILKNDTIFQSKTTCVCDNCYLEITKYCSMAGSNNENLIRILKMEESILNKKYQSNENPNLDVFNNLIRPKTSIKNYMSSTKSRLMYKDDVDSIKEFRDHRESFGRFTDKKEPYKTSKLTLTPRNKENKKSGEKEYKNSNRVLNKTNNYFNSNKTRIRPESVSINSRKNRYAFMNIRNLKTNFKQGNLYHLFKKNLLEKEVKKNFKNDNISMNFMSESNTHNCLKNFLSKKDFSYL